MIRPAKRSDIPDVLKMQRKHVQSWRLGSLDEKSVGRIMWRLVNDRTAFFRVYPGEDGKAAGYLLGATSAFWFAPTSRVATELAFWVDEQHRGKGAGAELLDAFMSWARDRGCEYVEMVEPSDSGVGEGLYAPRGFKAKSVQWLHEVE